LFSFPFNAIPFFEMILDCFHLYKQHSCHFCWFLPYLWVYSLHELCGVSLKSLLADQTAKMICIAVISDFEFGRFIVQNHATNWVFRHYLGLNLREECVFRLLLLVVKKGKRLMKRSKDVSLWA
jgi:hypothetical protein